MGKTKLCAAGIYDGTGVPMQKNAAVIIEEGKVVFAGAREVADTIPCDSEADYSDLYLFPGLFDSHCHVTSGMSSDGKLVGQTDPVLGALTAARNCKTDLDCGITTARCLGERNRIDIACAKAIDQGLIEGPRLVCAGQSIRSTHGHGIMASVADGPDEVRRAARANIAAGAKICKLLTSGLYGVPGKIRSDYTREEIFAFVDEAKRRNLPSTVHCIGGEGLKWCVEAGMECIEHGFFVSDDDIEMLLKYDRWLCMTPGVYMIDERRNSFVAETSANMTKALETSVECMSKAIKAGVKFVIGSDANHGNYYRELECFVKLGATAEQIVLAATRDAAIVCNVQDITGTLTAGKSADIIGMKNNPLEDIRAFGDLSLIMKAGVVHKAP